MDADTFTSNGWMAKRLDADHRTWLRLDLDELLDMRLLMQLHLEAPENRLPAGWNLAIRVWFGFGLLVLTPHGSADAASH